jgi:hypothetical protein
MRAEPGRRSVNGEKPIGLGGAMRDNVCLRFMRTR